MWPQQQVKIDKNPHTHVYLLFHMSVLIVSCKLHEISTGTFLCVLLILCEWPVFGTIWQKCAHFKDDLSASTLSAASSFYVKSTVSAKSRGVVEWFLDWGYGFVKWDGSTVWWLCVNVWPGFMKRLSDLESLQWNTLVYMTRSWREWLILLVLNQ